MAFGLSEREHGADVYSTDMVLTPASEEDRANGILYRASGEKYYIGNGNVASLVSVFGRRGDVEGQDALRLLRRRQPPRELPPHRQRRAHADLRQHVPAGELSRAGRGHPAHRRGSLCGRTEYGQRRQVQPVLVVDRHDRARLLRGDHPRAEPHPLRQPGHRLRSRPGQLRRRLRADDRDEGVQPARGRLLPQREPRGSALPAVQPHDQGQGHHGGRDGDAVAARRHRRQGLREEHHVPRGRPAHRVPAAAGGHRARQRRPGAEVHAELHAQSEGLPADSDPQRPGRRHLLLEAGAHPRRGRDPVRRLDARSTRSTPGSPTSPGSTSRRRPSASCW